MFSLEIKFYLFWEQGVLMTMPEDFLFNVGHTEIYFMYLQQIISDLYQDTS